MKNIAQLFSPVFPWLLLLSIPKGFCYQRINCQWGPYGDWSACDPCTKLQTRSRPMVVYAQFGGSPCSGEQTETRSCVTTQDCPLQEGCGDRFRCVSGKCISQNLVCNGDPDCEEDGLDERGCSIQSLIACDVTIPPSGIENLGVGFDMVEVKWRGSVINTLSFGGQCRLLHSGIDNIQYRLPLSIIQYSQMVKAQSDISDEMFESKWHYEKQITSRQTVSGTTKGYRNFDSNERYDRTQAYKLLVLKNEIEVGQFQSNTPREIPISEELWKALAKLPFVYDYAAYKNLLKRFGTHYVAEGSIGGSLNIIIRIDTNAEKHLVTESSAYKECVSTVRWFLFFPIRSESCNDDSSIRTPLSKAFDRTEMRPYVRLVGGDPQYSVAFQTMNFLDSQNNVKMYTNWVDSIRSFPKVIKQKLRPLSELVKEVPCAGVKRIYLRKAIEQYLAENHPCHCRPCMNNGIVVMENNECKCICKPGTDGPSCGSGAEEEGQAGVIHGSWSCWSAWSSCSGSRRSRGRSCSNPSPQNGGQGCIGELTETSECEDQQLHNLKIVEPQCFDRSLPPTRQCRTPPSLVNGYVLDPKDIYLVDSRVEYRCIDGFYLSGNSIIQCTAGQTWSARPGVCINARCRIKFLAEDVKVSPAKTNYDIGETVTLSCPKGRLLQGEATTICDASLNFSPDPANTKCGPVTVPEPTIPSVQCNLWEKASRGQCVCKMPFECGSSLELCATATEGSRKSIFANVCQLHVLQCRGKKYMLAEDSGCTWPQRDTAGCASCHMWEICDDQINGCRCRDSADCLTPGLNVCVRIGDNATTAAQTMSECEAGLRRCKGENVTVVSIVPCTS